MRVYAQPLSRLISIGKEEVPSSKIVINLPLAYEKLHILGETYRPNGLLDPSGQKRRHTSFYFCKRMNKLKLYSLFVWYAQFYFFIRYSHQIEFFYFNVWKNTQAFALKTRMTTTIKAKFLSDS